MKERLRQFVVTRFMLGRSPEDLSDNTSFLETGIIDSMGVVDLLTFLEEEFGVKVNDDEIIPENLDSLDSLCAFLDKKGVHTAGV